MRLKWMDILSNVIGFSYREEFQFLPANKKLF